MATVAETTVGRSVVWYDADNTHRWLDAIGPDVVKVIEPFQQTRWASANNLNQWTTTAVGTSTVAAVDGALGGAILITTGATENNGINAQVVGEAFMPSSQNQLYFGIKLQVSEATQNDFLVGLAITTTAALGGVTDGIYFRKPDESTTCSFVLEKNETETSTTALTVAKETDYVLEFVWDGSAITFYVDGVAGTQPVVTNLPSTEYLSPVIQLLTGSAAARTMTVKWMRCIQIV
jgi:hypothetical protein